MEMHRQEQEKLERLYRLYEQKMFRIAYSILNRTEQAEDAVSEVFLKLMYRMDQIREPESEETQWYLLRMIKNEAIDSYRKNQRENRYQETARAEAEVVVDPLSEWTKREDFRWKFRAGFQKLSLKYQEVIWLRFVKERSVTETAGLLGISEALVRKRTERARKILAEQGTVSSCGESQGTPSGYTVSPFGESQGTPSGYTASPFGESQGTPSGYTASPFGESQGTPSGYTASPFGESQGKEQI